MDKITLRLSEKIRLAGMFAVINYFVDYICSEKSKGSTSDFRINLDNYRMYQSRDGDDVFAYYFKQEVLEEEGNERVVFMPAADRSFVAPRGLMTKLGRSNARELLTPEGSAREAVGRVIEEYFQLNDETRAKLEAFYNNSFGEAPVVAVHLRGAGRKDGGTHKFVQNQRLENGVPFQLYFEKINHFIEQNPDAKVLICSDSQMVIKRVTEEYGSDRVIHYDSQLSDFGETHIALQNARDSGKESEYDARRMGEDVILEAWAMARSDYFVHGNSNISNFVVCLNSELDHVDIFQGCYSTDKKGVDYLGMKIKSLGFYWVSLIRRILGRINTKWGCPED
ncbi:MAG: hypothetical protein MI748_03885 [Opitutales bacterium]|nr:hypothetical protein [Opitutales bacterium]